MKYFIEKVIIDTFKQSTLYNYAKSGSESGRYTKRMAIILGYKNVSGIHSTEMVYPAVQDHWTCFNNIDSLLADIKMTDTFQNYKHDACIIAWCHEHELTIQNTHCYSSEVHPTNLDAYVQANFQRIFPNCLFMISKHAGYGKQYANMANWEYKFFQLSHTYVFDLVPNPRWPSDDDGIKFFEETALDPMHFQVNEQIIITYSVAIKMTYLNEEVYGGIHESYTGPGPLFNPENFAEPPKIGRNTKLPQMLQKPTKDVAEIPAILSYVCKCNIEFPSNRFMGHLNQNKGSSINHLNRLLGIFDPFIVT